MAHLRWPYRIFICGGTISFQDLGAIVSWEKGESATCWGRRKFLHRIGSENPLQRRLERTRQRLSREVGLQTKRTYNHSYVDRGNCHLCLAMVECWTLRSVSKGAWIVHPLRFIPPHTSRPASKMLVHESDAAEAVLPHVHANHGHHCRTMSLPSQKTTVGPVGHSQAKQQWWRRTRWKGRGVLHPYRFYQHKISQFYHPQSW